MAIRKRYTVVLQADAMRMLEELVAEEIAITKDVENIERDLSFSPQTAGVLKSSGYYLARRGAIELKYHVSDKDRLVRIIGVRRCAHPFDVVNSPAVRRWLSTHGGSVEGDQVLEAMSILVPQLRRDPRLLGKRGESGLYVNVHERVVMTCDINEPNCRVTIVSIDVV